MAARTAYRPVLRSTISARGTDEPNLDGPGRPLITRLQHEDGTWSPHEIPRRKLDNCADAAFEAGGLDKVTPEILERWSVSKAEYATFAMDKVKAHQGLERRRAFDEIMSREFSMTLVEAE